MFTADRHRDWPLLSVEWLLQSAVDRGVPVVEQEVRDTNLNLDELSELADLDEYALLLPALRTEGMADAIDKPRQRLALASLLHDRLALHSPAAESGGQLVDVLSEVAAVSVLEQALEQAEAQTVLQLAMRWSVRVHHEARVALNYAEEQLATEEAGLPVDWTDYGWLWQAAAAHSAGAEKAKQFVMADERNRRAVTRSANRVSRAGLCPECILHRMRLAPAGSHPLKAWAYEQPLDCCPHTGPLPAAVASVARVDPDSGLWLRDLP